MNGRHTIRYEIVESNWFQLQGKNNTSEIRIDKWEESPDQDLRQREEHRRYVQKISTRYLKEKTRAKYKGWVSYVDKEWLLIWKLKTQHRPSFWYGKIFYEWSITSPKFWILSSWNWVAFGHGWSQLMLISQRWDYSQDEITY